MTPEQIIQRVRELTRPGLVYVNLGKNDELADLAPKMADAYEAQARMLGGLLAVIHRDGGHYQAEHGTEKAVADAMRVRHELVQQVESQARELAEVKAERDALKAKVDELESLVQRLQVIGPDRVVEPSSNPCKLSEPVSDAYTLSRKLLGRTLEGDQ